MGTKWSELLMLLLCLCPLFLIKMGVTFFSGSLLYLRKNERK